MKGRVVLSLLGIALLGAACAGNAAPTAGSTTAPQATSPTQAAAQPTVSSAATSGAATSAGLSGTIPVGAVWSLTGAGGSPYGPSQKQASEMAVDEVNKSGMLGSAQIKLVTEDDRSEKEGGISAFDKLVNQDKVVAILGPTLSATALAADPIAQSKKVLVLGCSNTAGGIVEIGDYVFRDSLPESAVQPNTVKVTKDKLGYKKVAIMYADSAAFEKAGYDVFKKALEGTGVQIVDTETYKGGDTDFSAQLTKIKGTSPDAIFLSSLAQDAAGIMTQARQLGIAASVPFIGGNGLNSPQLAKLAGPAAEGVVSGAAWFVGNDSPGNQDFVKNYNTKYGANPDQFAAQAYAGVYILARAIKEANASDATSIRNAMAKLQNIDTVLGKFSFDANRNPVHTPVVQIVKSGKFELFK